MKTIRLTAIFVFFALAGCANLQRLVHVYSSEGIESNIYRYQDGGTSLYYSFTVNESPEVDTFVFFYGGSGCFSWKYVMPGYVDGLSVPARVFVLNKRFVTDRSTGMFGCSEEFYLANSPDQWFSDYSEFIVTKLEAFPQKPKNVVLVGVSEGALPAVRVAGLRPEITHVAIIGDGGYSMRKSLATLNQKGLIHFDIESGWEKISADPRSVKKKWYGNTYRWWYDILDIDPTPYFLKLNIPILVGIGEKDGSVPVESALYLESKFIAAGKSNLTLKVYPDADHLLNSKSISYRKAFFSDVSRLVRQRHK